MVVVVFVVDGGLSGDGDMNCHHHDYRLSLVNIIINSSLIGQHIQGDSGGPVTFKHAGAQHVLIGVVSRSQGKDCDQVS